MNKTRLLSAAMRSLARLRLRRRIPHRWLWNPKTRLNRRAFGLHRLLALAVVLASPTTAQPVIPAGFDLWTTAGDGTTLIDFAKFPIPPGFFSEDSDAFTGVVRFRGEPLVTDPPRILRAADTIVERLTDAVPDGTPIPIRMRALRLRSLKPITVRSDSGASRWDLEVNLTDEQPQTEMRFFANSRHGGHWDAEIGLDVRVSFVNTKTNEKLTADHSISLKSRGAKWRYLPLRSSKDPGRSSLTRCGVGIDTDADGTTDSTIEGWCGPSVFIPIPAKTAKAPSRQAAGHRETTEQSSYVHAVAQHSDQTGYAVAQLPPVPDPDPRPPADVGPPRIVIVTISVPVHENVAGGIYHTVIVVVTSEMPRLTQQQCPLFKPCEDNDPCTENDRCIPAPEEQAGSAPAPPPRPQPGGPAVPDGRPGDALAPRMVCVGTPVTSPTCP